MAKESNDLAKVFLEPNQKPNELSMNTKCGQRFGHGIYLTSIVYYVLTHCFEDQEQIISCYFRLCHIKLYPHGMFACYQ